jgi:hypothetical protein
MVLSRILLRTSSGILGAIAEFERERTRERVLAGLQRARREGKRLGRPNVRLPIERLQRVAGLPAHVAAARRVAVDRQTLAPAACGTLCLRIAGPDRKDTTARIMIARCESH